MIEPEEIPQFTGDLGLLEKAYGNLKADAGHIRSTGQDVHTRFQGLSAYYKAPEAEQLFASTKPVKDRADTFATGLESVSGALSGYATEIRPLVKKLEDLKDEATTFVDSVKDDDDWQYDGDKVGRHNRIRDEITRTVAAFWAAERTCHNKITALFPGGTQMVAGDGSDRKDQYGFDADDLKNAKLPWGDPVEEKHHVWEVGHWVKSFVWDGLIVDGVWGTIKGLGTLVGFGGWEAMGQAWKGLAQLATGLVLTSMPGLGTLFWALPDDKLPSWIRDSRTAMKETGKALVAWDEWGKNPARAAGAVTFNVLTTVFTGGAGGAASGAGKAGAVAKALSVAGKAGRVIDPMTYVAKGAGAGLSKIGDITKALKGIGRIDIPALPENAITLPKDAFRLPDGSFHLPEGTPLPEGATKLPNGTFKLPDDVPVVHDGAHPLPAPDHTGPLYGHPDGHIVDGNGKILIHADELHKPPTAETNLPHTPDPTREPALVGATSHTAEHAGEHIRLGSNTSHDLGDMHGIGDSRPTASSAHGGGHPSDGSVHHHGTEPSAVHESPSGHPNGNEGADRPHHDSHVGDGHDGSTVDHHDPHGGAHGHESDLGGGGDTHLPRDIDLDGPMANVPDGPSGSMPDGSWAGENGLHLDPEANRVADEFMDRSKKAEPDITQSMQSVASRVDEGKLIGLEYRLKGADSLKRKLATDLFENIGRRPDEVLGGIKDSIRYTMEVPVERYTHGVQQAIDELQAKGFENVTYKNTWDSAGYKGINSTWRDPVSGQAFEVQFHTADSFTAKMDGHILYEKERLPGVSPEELAAIKVEQTELFGRVPVPHGAADIRLGAHGSADVVPAISRESGGSAGHAVPPTHEPHGPPHDHQASDLHDPEHSVEPTGHGQGTSHGHQESPGESPYTEGPQGGWSGAGWVEKPDPIHDPDSVVAAEMYEHIRSTENRVELPAISKNTGVDESVLRQVKSHLFRSQHEVAIGPGTTKKGLFTPRRDIGELWFAAREGKLSEEGVQQFKHLMAHEYVESSLMKSGLPYIREYDHLWELDPSDGKYYRPQFPQDVRDAGAHDLAPNDKIGGFRHWRSLGMEHPGVVLADDLSNLDDVVKAIHQKLRSKGLEL